MPEQAEQEPTLQEIVVALRDVAAPAKPREPAAAAEPGASLYRLQPSRPAVPPLPPADARSAERPPPSGDPRAAEIARLVDENHRLNLRLFELLKTVERNRPAEERPAQRVSAPVDRETGSREAIRREAREAIRRELGPLLVALVKVLDAGAAPAEARQEAAPASRRPAPHPTPGAPLVAGNGHSFNWMVDLVEAAEAQGAARAAATAAAPVAGTRRPARGVVDAILLWLERRLRRARRRRT
jgi:hypothetical protein